MKGHKRHVRLWRFLHILAPFFRRMLRYEYAEETLDNTTILLANHTTNYDPILVGLSFMQQMYFVASEHTFRIPIASRLLNFIFAPIARVKGKTDARTGLEVVRAARRGYNVCLFAEGNRTFNGLTGPILASTGKLVKASGADLVTYKIEGGYFTTPRWGDKIRKGRMRGVVVGRYPAADIKKMDPEQINTIINRDLHEDAYARQAEEPVAFRGKRLAEYLETALHTCPKCGALGTLFSKGDEFFCTCGMRGRYTEYGYLQSDDFEFTTITQWDAWQQKALALRVQAAPMGETLMQDEDQRLYAVQLCQSSTLLTQGLLSLNKSEIRCGEFVFRLEDISDVAIVGRQTLTFSTADGAHYEIKCKAPRNALKYQQAFQELKYPLQKEEGA